MGGGRCAGLSKAAQGREWKRVYRSAREQLWTARCSAEYCRGMWASRCCGDVFRWLLTAIVAGWGNVGLITIGACRLPQVMHAAACGDHSYILKTDGHRIRTGKVSTAAEEEIEDLLPTKQERKPRVLLGDAWSVVATFLPRAVLSRGRFTRPGTLGRCTA